MSRDECLWEISTILGDNLTVGEAKDICFEFMAEVQRNQLVYDKRTYSNREIISLAIYLVKETIKAKTVVYHVERELKELLKRT